MSQALAEQNQLAKIEQVLVRGDLSVLTDPERMHYYKSVCETIGLNPLTKPFEYIQLNGKLVLYASKGCAEQLRAIHKVSIVITARETIEGVYVVTAQAQLPSGRQDGATGAVTISGLKGDALANAMMKAETKAKRRVTLSICGLNMLDETEVEAITPPENKFASGMGRIVADPPAEGDGFPDPAYKITFGKYQGRSLEEVGPEMLRNYIAYLEKKSDAEGKQLTGKVAEFVQRATDFIVAFEEMPVA